MGSKAEVLIRKSKNVNNFNKHTKRKGNTKQTKPGSTYSNNSETAI
jgi:hypothetical protein